MFVAVEWRQWQWCQQWQWQGQWQWQWGRRSSALVLFCFVVAGDDDGGKGGEKEGWQESLFERRRP